MNIDVKSVFENLPDFQGHEDARSWFKDQFQERFLLRNSDIIDGKRIYYYHIVKDPDTYHAYMESLTSPVEHEYSSTEPFESYSTVEISENGDISFSM
jgi:hypothetical protein